MSPLTPKQLQALTGVAQGLSPSAIAKEINVSERTLQRWAKLPQFQEALNQLQSQTKSRILEKVSETTSEKFTLDMRELQKQHLEAYQRIRGIAEVALAHYEQKLAQEPVEECNSKTLEVWVRILDRSLKGEAEASFMQNLDLDTALKCVLAAGFKVYDESQNPKSPVQMGDLEIATTLN